MDLSADFYRDEVRYGFYVPTAIKQAWAAELMVLAEIDRICQKYHITYYAEWGTLLGAVRHGGFIPWDDDMDIGMLRDDYIRFREAAKKELPEEYAIHDFETKENHWLFLSRVVNRNHICFDEEHLEKYHNFPYMASVDIFVMDYLYRDEKRERERCNEIKFILAAADAIVEQGLQASEKRMLKEIEKTYHMNFSHIESRRKLGIELYRLAERQMARVSRDEADFVGQMFPWILKGNGGMPKEYFEKMVRLPFEHTTVPAPARYHTVLQRKYGNYMEIYKGRGLHDYPFFEGQKKNLYALASDFRLPEFTFHSEMLANGADEKGFKEIVNEYTDVLQEQMNRLKDWRAEYFDILPECQTLAVDLGTLIEEVKGKSNAKVTGVISCIETYCEALYQAYDMLKDGFESGQAELLLTVKAWEDMRQTIEDNILQKNVILFVSTGEKQWAGFEKICEACLRDRNNEVYLVMVPVAFKDIWGRTTFKDVKMTEPDFVPESVCVADWRTFDVGLLHPDTIYIQDPYDGENPCLTVPPQYYAKNLRRNTRLLIYVPPFCVKEFGEDDFCDIYNMKHYVTAPALMYADEIFVQSDHMRRMYIGRLAEFAGEETRPVWEEKIRVGKLFTDVLADHISKRTIVYTIGVDKLAAYRAGVIEIVKKELEDFAKSSSEITLKICLYPSDMGTWKEIDSRLAQNLLELIGEYAKQDWCELCRETWETIAGPGTEYYGSPSPLVHLFTAENKNVTIVE